MYFQLSPIGRTIETSICNLILLKFDENGRKVCECHPTTRRDLLRARDFWIERWLLRKGFIIIVFGVFLQLIGYMVQLRLQALRVV